MLSTSRRNLPLKNERPASLAISGVTGNNKTQQQQQQQQQQQHGKNSTASWRSVSVGNLVTSPPASGASRSVNRLSSSHLPLVSPLTNDSIIIVDKVDVKPVKMDVKPTALKTSATPAPAGTAAPAPGPPLSSPSRRPSR